MQQQAELRHVVDTAKDTHPAFTFYVRKEDVPTDDLPRHGETTDV